MLSFKKFSNARRVLVGIEFVQKIIKGQFRIPTHFGRNLGSILADRSRFMNCICASLQQIAPDTFER